MIKITGDTHGELGISRLNNKHIKDKKANFPNYVIIAGDFGIIWAGRKDKHENYWLNWLDSKPFETLVVLGNHENYERIYQLPTEERFGAKVYKVSEKVYILQHGNMYNIEGNNIFVFGGAESIDKIYRTNRISWWEEEIPTYADFYRGVATLAVYNYKCDYVITHTAPEEVVTQLLTENKQFVDKITDPTCKMLSEFATKIDCKKWYFGHFHIDKKLTVEDIKYQAIYEKIEEMK